MAGRPLTRARKAAAAARAAEASGVAPTVIMGESGEPLPAPPRSMTMTEFVQEGKRKHVRYSAELAAELIEAVSCGVPLAEYCATPGRPSRRSVVKWKSEYPEFAKQLHEARLFRAESRADSIDSILTDVQQGRLDPISGRMLLDGHRYLMSKENSRYAENSTQRVELSGPGGAPLLLDGDPAQAKEIARFYALILARGAAAEGEIELGADQYAELPAPGR